MTKNMLIWLLVLFMSFTSVSVNTVKAEETEDYDQPETTEVVDDGEVYTIEEIKNETDEVAKAATEFEGEAVNVAKAFKAPVTPGTGAGLNGGEPIQTTGDWTFDAYYVNVEDPKNIVEHDDFSLKYQMEFHTSEIIAAGLRKKNED